MRLFAILATFLVTISACSEDPVPKPRGYFRIDLPEHKYSEYFATCNYSFDLSESARVVADSAPGAEPCWINIDYPKFNARIHISYKNSSKDLKKYMEDSYTLAFKHTIKADAIDEQLYADSANKVYGILYDIKGNAASNLQFFLTDSVSRFMRGALYFNVEPNKDSLAPVIDFLREDITHLVESFRWTDD